jgi:hypothetical protein
VINRHGKHLLKTRRNLRKRHTTTLGNLFEQLLHKRSGQQAKEVPPKISQHSAVRLYGRHDARPF